MFNTKVGKWRFQGGGRYELTEKESKEFDPLRNSAVAAAGFPVALAWTSGMRPAPRRDPVWGKHPDRAELRITRMGTKNTGDH